VNFQRCGIFGAVGALAAQLTDAIASEIANAQLPTVALVLELLIIVLKIRALWKEVN
jgi:hypothetical protein